MNKFKYLVKAWIWQLQNLYAALILITIYRKHFNYKQFGLYDYMGNVKFEYNVWNPPAGRFFTIRKWPVIICFISWDENGGDGEPAVNTLQEHRMWNDPKFLAKIEAEYSIDFDNLGG